jgi:integrase
MKVRKRKGSFLEPDMVRDLIETAGEWEEELRRRGRPDQCFGRRSLVTVLCLCGPRISELVAADGGDFDLGAGLWRIPDSKTPAGVRLVEATDFVAAEIRAHVARKKADSRLAGAADPMWVSSNGTRLGAENVRRMLRGLVKRTNEKREAEGKMLLPHVTPHTLRRTFASMCFWAKRELPWVMDQIGHEDSRMTVEVYASASKRKRVDRKLVWRFMRFADEPKRAPGSGRG